jgi:hypothetical protein
MEIIKFHCPACRTQLRVPPAAAGFQGPCPACGRDIIGPIPNRGLEARLAPKDAFSPFPGNPFAEKPEEPTPAPIPETPEPEPFVPFSDPPALTPTAPVEVPAAASPPAASQPPFADRPTPAAAPAAALDEPPECLAPRHVRRLRAAVLILSCLLCSLISYIAGYLTALKRQVVSPPIFADVSAMLPPPAASDDAPPPGVPLPEPAEDPANSAAASTPEADPVGSPPAPQPGLAAEATLKAFLSAPDWASRLAYVMDPEDVRAAMKKHAEKEGDGPIEIDSIESAYVFPDQEHFIIKTKRIATGFPVTIQRVGDDWRIDWETFEEFHGDAFRRFASGTLGENGEFHLYLKPQLSQDPNGFVRYQLTAPIEGRSYPAFAKRGSIAQAKITALLESESMKENPDIQKLLAKDGIPLILKLSYQSRGQNQNFLQLEDLVAQGWGR